jgi:hypothetical protein
MLFCGILRAEWNFALSCDFSIEVKEKLRSARKISLSGKRPLSRFYSSELLRAKRLFAFVVDRLRLELFTFPEVKFYFLLFRKVHDFRTSYFFQH